MKRIRTVAAVAACVVLAGCAGQSADPRGARLWGSSRDTFAKATPPPPPPPPPPPDHPLVPRTKHRTLCPTPGAGDLNGDGHADVVVAETLGESEPGGIRILYGTVGGLTAGKRRGVPNDQALDQNTPGVPGVIDDTTHRWGYSLAVADFDRDGCADVAVGVPGEGGSPVPLRHEPDASSGAVHILYGTPAGLSTAGLTVVRQGSETPPDATTVVVPDAQERGDEFGSEVAAGDFDGDGYADLAVAAANDAPGPNQIRLPGPPIPDRPCPLNASCLPPGPRMGPAPDRGMVTVLYGSRKGLGRGARESRNFTHTMLGGTSDDGYLFGRTMTTGDFDADGADDLVISAPPGASPTGEDTGVVHVVAGRPGAGLDTTQVRTFRRDTPGVPGEGRDELLGYTLAAGDLDGDRRDDLAIGSYDGGVLVLYSGRVGLTGAGAQEWTPGALGDASPGREFGRGLTIGQFGGPGTAEDLAVGPGSVTLFFGDTGGLSASRARVIPSSAVGRGARRFAEALAAYPVRGGAYDDLLVGAPETGPNGAGALVEIPTGLDGPRPAAARTWRPGTPGMTDRAGYDGFMGREIG